MRIVLVEPQIPANTGNIVRTCSATGTPLILIKPLGFHTSDRALKRAGLDYWLGANVSIEESLNPLLTNDFYFFSTKGKKLYTDIEYSPHSTLIFGSETSGLPQHLHDEFPDHFYRIPMIETKRSLNLSNAVAIVLYHSLATQGFGTMS